MHPLKIAFAHALIVFFIYAMESDECGQSANGK